MRTLVKALLLGFFSSLLSLSANAQAFCAEGFVEPHYGFTPLYFLKLQAEKTFDWQIKREIESGDLAQAARRAEEKGFRSLAFEINRTLKDILEHSLIKPGFPKRIELRGIETYWVEFPSGVKAVFRPEKDSLQKEGVDTFYQNNPFYEVAAYRLAKIFGIDGIPVATFRRVNGMYGSIQGHVKESGRPQNQMINPLEGNAHPTLVRSVADLFIFDFIIRNIERSDLNIIFDGLKVWGLDNGVSFIPQANSAFNRPLDQSWVDSVNLAFAQGLRATTPGMIRNQLNGLMKPQQIEEVIQRHRQILARLPESPISAR